MPVYEYKCNACGEKFEIQRSMCDSDKETKCPKCGSKDCQKVYSLSGQNPASKAPFRFG
ncbi:MAG: zinc ribbon domain-containing protein [Chloroflexota bacterium]